VTPNAPAIRNLIGRTNQWIQNNPSKYAGLSQMVGYNANASPKLVIEQVDAIFDTLQFQYHVTYSSDNIPHLLTQDDAQIIHLPSDILANSAPSGMCVETTAIMASAIESLGMRPYFIIIPGHAFLGVALSSAALGPTEFWETSYLGSGVDGEQARIYGDGEYAKYWNENNIQDVINVSYERQQNIVPIE
jgi:hypothetical protein